MRGAAGQGAAPTNVEHPVQLCLVVHSQPPQEVGGRQVRQIGALGRLVQGCGGGMQSRRLLRAGIRGLAELAPLLCGKGACGAVQDVAVQATHSPSRSSLPTSLLPLAWQRVAPRLPLLPLPAAAGLAGQGRHACGPLDAPTVCLLQDAAAGQAAAALAIDILRQCS